MEPIKRELRPCPICAKPIKKTGTMSWGQYTKVTACSPKCAAIMRQARIRNGEGGRLAAARSLYACMQQWAVQEENYAANS